MRKVVSPLKSIGLGLLYVALWIGLQTLADRLVPDTVSWPRSVIQSLLLLAPVVFVPLVGRASSLFLASLGTASALFLIVLIGSFFQGEYDSTDWRGVGLVIGILLGVSVFIAWPVLCLTQRKRPVSEPAV